MKKERESKKKDPATAAILALVGGLLIGFPGIGYIYMNNIKKGLVYGAVYWMLGGILAGIIAAAYFLGGILTLGLAMILCLPAFFLLPIYVIVVTYDTYLYANGEKTILPEIK